MIGDHRLVFTCVSLLTGVLCGALRDRRALLLEHLLLRQQLAVALRTRRRPRVRWHDRLFWVVMQRLCADWCRRLVLVQPEAVLTPFRAPKAIAVAKRVVRTLRTECLDHVLVLNERHLRSVLAEYVAYY